MLAIFIGLVALIAGTANAQTGPTLISPANGAASVALNPTLSWNSLPGSTSYELQVSIYWTFSSLLYDLPIDRTMTSQEIGPLGGNTEYYWRVSATNANGIKGAWSSTWNFTTVPIVPVAPVLSSPSNGATGVLLNPTLSWSASSGATSYELQVSTTANFSSIVSDIFNLGGQISSMVTGLSTNTYYWRVNATSSGGTSDWSSVWTFTTNVSIPTIPALSTPGTDSIGVAVNPTVSWGAVTGAASYTLQVSTDSANFTSPVVNQAGLTALSYNVTTGLANNTKYYWRVNATNTGGTSAWSLVWSFTTVIALSSVPGLLTPSNSATGVAINPTLCWNKAVGAVSCRIQVSTTSNFSNTIKDSSGVTDTSLILSGLTNNTIYYWHVDATNAGGISAWASTWSFTTIVAVPIAPVLSSPSIGSTGVAVNPTVSWGAVTGAASYTLQVSTDSANFISPVVNQAGLTAPSYNVASGLANNAKYFWRVNATNAGGTSAWSLVWSFNTIVALPTAVALVSPVNTFISSVDSVNLVWNKGDASVTKYFVEVAIDSGFTNFFSVDSGVTDTFKIVKNLTNQQTYWWQAKAYNEAGWGPFSGKRKFTIDISMTAILPRQFELRSSSCNGSADILHYALPHQCFVSLKYHDVGGRLIGSFVNQTQEIGYYSLALPVSHWAKGTYIREFKAGSLLREDRFLLVR